MDISSRFSLVDFLAYFFPGVLDALGIYSILLFTPLNAQISQIKLDVSSVILLFVISYVIGVILSGFSEILIRAKYVNKPKSRILIPEYKQELLAAFNDIFCEGETKDKAWSQTNFYLCRALVTQYMPSVADFFQRQSSLRQLKLNLIPSIILGLLASVIWGITLLIDHIWVWGGIVIVVSVIISVMIISTLFNRMINNEEREVREVQTAFLAGYKCGVFTKIKKDPSLQEIPHGTMGN